MHFYKTPALLKSLTKKLYWDIKGGDRDIYLTFDDGPIPGLTEYILDMLDAYAAKATFFCVGDNVRKYPEIAKNTILRGHRLGNHTFNHVKGWQSSSVAYLDNIKKCQHYIDLYQPVSEPAIFRPPYGQITPGQIALLSTEYHIIMWDVLAYDFEKKHNAQKSLDKILSKTGPGSIVVFHDNYKAEEKLKYMLPRFLSHFKEKGFNFKKIGQ
ncbi:MAG: polysaccharide deacetylase family protein [Cyclobacteriaceae bacterium]|nr:polysaccharide deacetylase family protein [Cyclobacteriaceae bacterium]